MKHYEFNYHLSNAEHAMNYLQEMSQSLQGKEQCNNAFNHSLSVARIVKISKQLFYANDSLKQENEELKKQIEHLKSGEYQELLNKDREKLQSEFESLKNALTQFILDYPDIDNY